ncbi:MAG: ElyC/SanA/YdcF family protein [Candidatus Rokubacteria bacterium]|nr:ElyC/SanA/YdcF family protein [Candidatus Rokubacteria bacterium]
MSEWTKVTALPTFLPKKGPTLYTPGQMYYVRSLTTISTYTPRDFTSDWRFLDFREFQHSSQRRFLTELLATFEASLQSTQRTQTESAKAVSLPVDPNDVWAYIADAAAAVVTQLHYRSVLQPTFLKRALGYCHFVVQHLGYEPRSLDALRESVVASQNNVMLVVGCQTPTLLYSRVDAAARLLIHLSPSFRVVFAGKNPGAPATIPNEAREMEVYFSSLVERDPVLDHHKRFRVEVESQSSDTKTNFAHFLNSSYLSLTMPNRLFVVSSTFHLMRIAQELDRWSDALGGRGVVEIVLVGAEGLHDDHQAKQDRMYVKSMVYEVFLDMFKRRPLDRPSL